MGARGPKPKPAHLRQGHRRAAESRAALNGVLRSLIPPEELAEDEEEPDPSPAGQIIRDWGRGLGA